MLLGQIHVLTATYIVYLYAMHLYLTDVTYNTHCSNENAADQTKDKDREKKQQRLGLGYQN